MTRQPWCSPDAHGVLAARGWGDGAGGAGWGGQRTAHGLRKAAARRLAEAGCIPRQIAAITGHASLKEIARYIQAANQQRLVEQAMAKIELETPSGKPLSRSATSSNKA